MAERKSKDVARTAGADASLKLPAGVKLVRTLQGHQGIIGRIAWSPDGRRLRYPELNPVRAGLVGAPEAYRWSSAAVHCGSAEPEAVLDMSLWQQYWTAAAWRDYLTARDAAAEVESIRESTHTGRPLGTPGFIERIEGATGRRLVPRKGGRPPQPPVATGQGDLMF